MQGMDADWAYEAWRQLPLNVASYIEQIQDEAFHIAAGVRASTTHHENHWGCPRGVMVKAMGCGIVVREFVL